MKLHGNALVAQSGGPTAVINNSVCGVVHAWRNNSLHGKLLGALCGIKGVLEEKFIDLSAQSNAVVDSLRHTPGAALGSCRYKIDGNDYDQLLKVFKKHAIRYFFYIGGNDSMDTACKINNLALHKGYDIKVIGIPKTVDNDLPFTDHCPGYGSAAKYLATVVMNTGMDLKSLITSTRVVILETMGRNTGWLAAATVLARRIPGDPPHLIYLPEVPFSETLFLQEVERVYQKLGYVYIVASEGLIKENGEYLFASQSRDSFGHIQLGGLANTLKSLVEKELSIKVRCNIPGTVQRSAIHFASRVDAEDAYQCGEYAVELAAQDQSGLMVTLDRIEDNYLCQPGSVELEKVANVEKKFPLEWIIESGCDINSAFIRYAQPLIQGEVCVPTKDGLPDYTSLLELTAHKS